MRAVRLLLLLVIPVVAAAHPGGGLIALDANTVIFGDSMYNAIWRLEKGKKPLAVMKNFHAHWTTRGMDGHIYSESFQEMGGAAFRIDLAGGKHVKVAEESHFGALVFAVGKQGEFIFQKGPQIVERTGGTVTGFRGSGAVAKGEPPLQQVIAYYWAADGTLYLSDGNHLRRVGNDGVVRLVARIDGNLIEPKIWNSTGAPRIWSIAIDDRKRIYTALPDIGQVVRVDPDGSQHVVDRSVGGWRVTAVATFGDSVFMLESSDSTNDGQRVRVLRDSGKIELLGQVETSTVNVLGHFSGVKHVHDDALGYALKLWQEGDQVFGLLHVYTGAPADPPTGILEQVMFNPRNRRFSFSARLSTGIVYARDYDGVPSRDRFTFSGVLTRNQVVGTLTRSNDLFPNRPPTSRRIRLRRSALLTEVMIPPPPTYSAWKPWADEILVRLGPKW